VLLFAQEISDCNCGLEIFMVHISFILVEISIPHTVESPFPFLFYIMTKTTLFNNSNPQWARSDGRD
jgi:hypothetical protein